MLKVIALVGILAVAAYHAMGEENQRKLWTKGR